MSKLTSYEKAWLRWVSSALDHNRLTGLDRELAMNSQGVVFGPPSGKKNQYLQIQCETKVLTLRLKSLADIVRITHPDAMFAVTVGPVKPEATAAYAMRVTTNAMLEARRTP